MIYFYTIGDKNVASSRMRVWHVAGRYNERYNVRYNVSVLRPYRSAFSFRAGRCRDFFVLFVRVLKPKSVFYVHKIVSPPEIVYLFVLASRIFSKKIIFDFDDQIDGRWAKKMLKIAGAVVVSSHELAKFARQYNKNVHLIPTAVPLAIYNDYLKQSESESLIIGWIGSAKGQLANLALLASVFNLSQEKLLFKFKLVGAQGLVQVHEMFKKIPGLNVEIIDEIDWASERDVAKTIQSFDVGVMPLENTPRNRAKAGFKLIQYMALGIPVIASPVGENNYIIADGQNGFLASDTSEWVDRITIMLNNPDIRKKLGEAGRKIVEQKYSLENALKLYKDVIL